LSSNRSLVWKVMRRRTCPDEQTRGALPSILLRRLRDDYRATMTASLGLCVDPCNRRQAVPTPPTGAPGPPRSRPVRAVFDPLQRNWHHRWSLALALFAKLRRRHDGPDERGWYRGPVHRVAQTVRPSDHPKWVLQPLLSVRRSFVVPHQVSGPVLRAANARARASHALESSLV